MRIIDAYEELAELWDKESELDGPQEMDLGEFSWEPQPGALRFIIDDLGVGPVEEFRDGEWRIAEDGN